MNPASDLGSGVAAMQEYLFDLQRRITATLAAIDGSAAFRADDWSRPDASKGLRGHGRSAVLEEGGIIEKGGVNVSVVEGDGLPPSASASRPELAGRSFKALGLSLVIHPRSPFAPTSHANIRLFVAEAPGQPSVWWFGGGFDLTPYYGFDEDCISWHRAAQQACAPFGAEVYPRYKAWCDAYFHLKHRGEQRGIGGIFFDDLHEWGFERCLAFVKAVGEAYLQAYSLILSRRGQLPCTPAQRAFQEYRRGRYVEFNLVFDRGTLFGLQSGGRTESILMSLPPVVRWQYDRKEEPGSQEALLYERYLQPRDWLAPHP